MKVTRSSLIKLPFSKRVLSYVWFKKREKNIIEITFSSFFKNRIKITTFYTFFIYLFIGKMGQISPSQPNSPCPLLLLQNGPLWLTLTPWPNNHLLCVRWKEVYKTLHFSSHFRCGINVKGFKEQISFVVATRELIISPLCYGFACVKT